MDYLKFLGVLFLIFLASLLGNKNGYNKGYREGIEIGMSTSHSLKEYDIKVGLFGDMQRDLKDCVSQYNELVEKANLQISSFKKDNNSCEGRLRSYEFQDSPNENLYPEDVKDKEPTQVDYDIEDFNNNSSDYNPITKEYKND